ncbi:YceI family protein [Chloroflexota bacterium]
MLRFIYLIITVLLFVTLAGCGSSTTPTPEQSAIAPVLEPTLAAVEEAATGEPTAEPVAAIRTFRIVPEASEASYAIDEEFFNRPVHFFTAVGRTNAIEGEFQLQIDGNHVELGNNQFTVDLRTLSSDDNRRDNRIRKIGLQSNTFPWAEFTATAIEAFPEDAAEGQDVSFKLIGDMTIREISNPQIFEVTAKLEDNTFTGTATTFLFTQDYGFDPPNLLNVLKVTDGVTVTVEFTAEEAH